MFKEGVMQELILKGEKAKIAASELSCLESGKKDQALIRFAELLVSEKDKIISANSLDLEAAVTAGLKGAIVERLTLNGERIKGIAEGIKDVVRLEDPVGEVMEMKKRPNGLIIGKKRVPIGVIGVIFESRPNVTADVAALCVKTGNACILRGGKEAIHSNMAIAGLFKQALAETGINPDAVQLVEDTTRESSVAMMKMNEYLDILIPRGGAGLIRAVVENSTVPVIETGVGNCHIYFDESADLEKAIPILVNAKTQRPGVCNAAESLLIHEKIAEKALPLVARALTEKKVKIRGDETCLKYIPEAVPATEEDWGTEYLDMIISVKTVGSLDEAVCHINKYGTGHSESIITENYTAAQYFLDRIDAAAVYVNASTRFTDGYEFGYGAEIGISTQKLHAAVLWDLRNLPLTNILFTETDRYETDPYALLYFSILSMNRSKRKAVSVGPPEASGWNCVEKKGFSLCFIPSFV